VLRRVKSKLQSRNLSLQRSALSTFLQWLKRSQSTLARLTGPHALEALLDDGRQLQQQQQPSHNCAGGGGGGGSSEVDDPDGASSSLELPLYRAPPDSRVPVVLDDIVYLVIDISVASGAAGGGGRRGGGSGAAGGGARTATRLLCTQVLGCVRASGSFRRVAATRR
jgi:hypothetical protein